MYKYAHISREGEEAEELSMECLEQVLRFHNKTQKCWLAQLHASSSLTVFDLLVYLILFRVNHKPKNVLHSLKHHVKEGSLNSTLIQVGYLSHCHAAICPKPILKPI